MRNVEASTKIRSLGLTVFVIATIGATSAAEGQSTTCNTGGNVLGVLGCALQGYAQDEAVRQRRAADSIALANQLDAARSEAARSRAYDSVSFLLFSEKALDVIAHLRDSLSLGLFPPVLASYNSDATTAALRLYAVDPRASTQEIRDQIVPHAKQYAAPVDAWMNRFVSVMSAFYTSAKIPPKARESVLVDSWRAYFDNAQLNIDDDATAIRYKIDSVFARHSCTDGHGGKWDQGTQRCTTPVRKQRGSR